MKLLNVDLLQIAIISLFLKKIGAATSILSPTYRSISDEFSIAFGIPGEKKKVFAMIDMKNQYPAYNSAYHREKGVDSTETVTAVKGNKTFPCVFMKDQILLSEIEITLTFCNIVDSMYFSYGAFTLNLPFKFADVRFSLIHDLAYNQKRISELLFAFEPVNKEEGLLHIGGIPFSTRNGKYSNTCKVNENYSTWGCDLRYVYIGNYENYKFFFNNENTYAYFQPSESLIYAPKKFFDFLVNTVFSKYLSSKQCTFNMYPNFNYIDCKCSVPDELGKMYLSFGKREFSIQMRDLFKKYNAFEEPFRCDFLVVENLEDEPGEREKWIFGTLFLQKYVSIFDYTSKSITFLSDYPFFESEVPDGAAKNELSLLKSILSFLIVLLLIPTFILFFNKYYFKKFS